MKRRRRGGKGDEDGGGEGGWEGGEDGGGEGDQLKLDEFI